jgi:hypothetical protein
MRDERTPAPRQTCPHLVTGTTSTYPADWLEDFHRSSSGILPKVYPLAGSPYCRILSGAGFPLPGDAFLRIS